MEILITIGYIALCVLFFSLAIAIHEFGHFVVALKLGLKVERFSLGFGPALWKKTYKGVEYRISAIPLGGYVSIPDVDPEGTKAIEGAKNQENAIEKREIAPWKELAVAVAGPAMNIVLAVILAFILAAIPSAKFGILSPEIGSVVEDGPAAKAGMMAGDKVLKVGDSEVSSWSEMMTEIQIAGERAIPFVVLRENREVVLEITPRRDEVTDGCYIMALSTTNATNAAMWMPARNPLKQLEWDAMSIFRVLKGLTNPKEAKSTSKALGGPVMIAEGIYSSVRKDFWDGVGFLRFLNVNLAVLNLLPIPVLDGGLILFALIALIFRRRVPEKIVSWLSMFFMVVLMGLMGLLILRDGMRSYRIHTYNPSDGANDSSSTDISERVESK
jgi:regulator of sigma E protease